MPIVRIILPVLLLPAVASVMGCHPLDPTLGPGPVAYPPAGAVAGPWPAAPVAQPQPIYEEPGVIYLPPGVEMAPQPSVVLPPSTFAVDPPPSDPAATNWWDVLPAGADAISPDFGLPRAPVVENRVPNPIIVPVANHELAWDQLVDVVTDYFPVQRERPVQQADGFLAEGFIETPFQVGATLLEPQRNDSVGRFNRWQATLQSIRRKAFVNVQPTGGGYAIRVNVIKQLEDLPQPELGLASAAVLRNDNSLPSGRQAGAAAAAGPEAWIDLGRDEPIEQEMLRRLQERLAAPLAPAASRPVFY